MSESILIFTFSPVQSFIAEARRAADLYVASAILSQIAEAAGVVLNHHGTLVYPANLTSGDAPNKLVARVPANRAEEIARDAKKKLLERWQEIAKTARESLARYKPAPDQTWEAIWERQIKARPNKEHPLWEVYWAICAMEDKQKTYAEAYRQASRALDAAKRSRCFAAAEEAGLKDSLSGRRSALHLSDLGAKDYWADIGKQVGAAKLRPGGHERLDAIGAVKRFSQLADQRDFLSTSTVASADFLTRARPHLGDYRQIVEDLLGQYLYVPRKNDQEWPYDGDLLFLETLKKERLEDSYGGIAQPDLLPEAQNILREIYKELDARPSPYYAVIALDGDSMGRRIDHLLESGDLAEHAHRSFSASLATFAGGVKIEVEKQLGRGFLIYNGGDDVLMLAPLSQSLPLASKLADNFKKTINGTASAGLVIAHHLYPLDAALETARQAEELAKSAMDKAKAAVCVDIIRRSGERMTLYSPWSTLEDNFEKLVGMFQSGALASRFPYVVMRSAYALPEADEKFRSELKRLLQRHRDGRHPQAPEPEEWAGRLNDWAARMPHQCVELGQWLALARFVAQGGGE
jgi:CRISPR-associated protein Cmr2